jgi:hypothetical protein
VIRLYYEYPGEPPGEKLFIVLNPNYVSNDSEDEIVFCIKATSKVARYQNDPEQMDGCVYYRARTLAFFPVDTAIQPDNGLPLAHSRLGAFARARKYRVEGKMPAEFHNQLVSAITNSITLKPKAQRVLLRMTGETGD